jgi:hypothetical protein
MSTVTTLRPYTLPATVPSRRQLQHRTEKPLGSVETHVRSDPVYVLKAQLFRVLGHPIRIRILELLLEGERTVGDLQAALRLDSSGTSQHLAALRQQGGAREPACGDQRLLPDQGSAHLATARGRKADPDLRAV